MKINEILNSEKYVMVCWPDSQDIMELDGFDDNAYSINAIDDADGSDMNAYMVNLDWLTKSLK